MQALQNFERQPARAYLDLITAGEILSNYFEYDKGQLLDHGMRSVLEEIETGCERGPVLADYIRNQLFYVKRRFVETLDKLVTKHFFAHSESALEALALKESEFRQRMASAYDLRSKYVHTGIDFGEWITANDNHEVPFAKLQVGDKDFQKTLMKAPTYFGLERAIRFSLLRFIHLYSGRPLDSRLDNDSAPEVTSPPVVGSPPAAE